MEARRLSTRWTRALGKFEDQPVLQERHGSRRAGDDQEEGLRAHHPLKTATAGQVIHRPHIAATHPDQAHSTVTPRDDLAQRHADLAAIARSVLIIRLQVSNNDRYV